jgi:YYY domain-containing protein
MEALPLARWAVMLAVLTAVGAPLSALVFAPLPRRGAAFSLPTALLVWATVVFLVGQVTFGRHTVVLGVLVVGALSLLASRRGHVPNWRAVAGSYCVTLVGFCIYAIWAANHGTITPVGGEQFLHYGLTNSLVGTNQLPPEDFWFAGEQIRYYYGTQLQVAGLSVLSGTELRIGYNLGLATFFSVLVVSAYGLVGSVVASADRSFRTGGALGVVLVAFGGTLIPGVRQLLGRLPTDAGERYADVAFGGIPHFETATQALTEQGSSETWSWFFSRYVIEDGLHEFPLYSFIKADLHGHTLSLGYVLVAAALAYSYYLTPASDRWQRAGILYGGLGVVAGVFGFMNTWSFPTAFGLAWLAIAAGPNPASLLGSVNSLSISDSDSERPADGSRLRVAADELWRLVLAALLTVPVAVVGFAIASPFLLGGVPTNEGVGLFPPRTDLLPFLLMYGGLLAVAGAYLLGRSLPAVRSNPTATAVAVSATLALVAGLFVVDAAVIAASLPVLLCAWWLVRTERGGFAAVLLVAGLGLLVSLELVYAKVWPLERVRWNTTLKVAVQGYTLLAAGAAAMAALLLTESRDRLRSAIRGWRSETASGSFSTRLPDRSTVAAVSVVVLVVGVVLASLPFAGLLATNYVGFEGADPTEGTLDSLAAHDTYRGDEMAAMYWLDERLDPTIVEAPSRFNYRWENAASVFTDAVTVAGWNHQAGYRGVDAYDRRASEAESVYEGPWADAAAVLEKYDVDYVWVGPAERERFSDMREFADRPALSVAFENSAVTIYAIHHDRL